ncbi:e3 sumo-protein ligase nse2 [Limosa lapponica baueri]|uniref:E3 sumo-protein ligase nse2 n=1 Tax=Limosa lapponica baueri TaxID=1758121 RepID=A0A2I0TW90_LIMLA|nr:e3 sumo-protein ligase nse2 [Limosa lapponica baueri]
MGELVEEEEKGKGANGKEICNEGEREILMLPYQVLRRENDVEDVNSMENVMLEYAAMDRELNHYMKAIEETVHQVNWHFY